MKDYCKIFDQINLPTARMICSSKTGYYERCPEGQPVFNANIFCKEADRKVWFGDLDLVLDEPSLILLVDEIGEFCIVSEMDGRFENETRSYEEVLPNAVKVFK